MTRARDIADVGYKDELVEDTTPQLGGALDAQDNGITNVNEIGIGVTSPAKPLHVEGGGDYNMIMRSASNRSGLAIHHPGTGALGSPLGSALVLESDDTFRLGTQSFYNIIMDQSGRVTMPKQPFFAAAWNQSATGFVTGTYGVIHNNGGFTQTNGKIYVPTAGWYFVNAYGIATDQFDTRVVANTTGSGPFLFDFRQSNYSGGTHHGCGNGRVVYLASGSYVGIHRLSSTMYTGATSNSPHNLISIMLMG